MCGSFDERVFLIADCYITIQTDKTISRLHANLITEEAKAPKPDINDVADIPRMSLRVHDLSKFGTFVNKQPGSKPLTSVPGCEAPLNDGDIVTFGTNKTSFRYLRLFLLYTSSFIGKLNICRSQLAMSTLFSEEKNALIFMSDTPWICRVEFVPFFLCISASNVRKENPTSKFALRHGKKVNFYARPSDIEAIA